MTIILLIGILALAYAAFESFFAGEKYWRWYFRQYGKDANDYDIKCVKVVRGICLMIMGMLCFSIELFVDRLFWLPVFIAASVLIAHFVVVFSFCKKK